MPFFLHHHAVLRMTQRGISREEIRETLERVEVRYPSEDDPTRTVILGKTSAGRPLKVVVESNDHEAVVTVARRDEEG